MVKMVIVGVFFVHDRQSFLQQEVQHYDVDLLGATDAPSPIFGQI